MSSPRVCILIPSFEGGDVVLDCLKSVHATVGAVPAVLVMDDASSDGTPDRIRERYPHVEVVVAEENQGFARNCNAGFERALSQGSEFVFLLNQDTRIAPGLIENLVRFADLNPAAAVVAPKTFSFNRDADGRERLIYAGSWQSWLPLLQRVPGINEPESSESDDPRKVDFAWGHGILVRCSALRQVGGFDADFPMYYEDLDLCVRLRRAGFEIWCEPRAVMWHDQPDGARAEKSEYWRWACKVQSTSAFYLKHFGSMRALALVPLTIAAELRRLVFACRLRAAWHLLKAYIRWFLGFQDPLRSATREQGSAG